MSQPVVLVVVNRDRLESSLRRDLDHLLARLAPVVERVGEAGDGSPPSVEDLRSRRLDRQRTELVALLEECGGNLAEVARRLGKSRGAVIYWTRKFGLQAPRRRGGGGRSR